MLAIFKKPLKKEILELSIQILDTVFQNDFETDSCGIEDGNEIISEYLAQNELRLAFEHLEYVVSEVELSLTFEQTKKMGVIAAKLGIKNNIYKA